MYRNLMTTASAAITLISSVLVGVPACGNTAQVCVPGDQKFCACPGEKLGIQACREDGSGYNVCDCNEGSGGTGSGSTGSGVSAGCGNGVIELGEECDDGNKANGDGCNFQCDIESSTPVPDGEPLGATSGSPNVPVAFSACNNETTTQAFTPGPQLTIRACAIRYVDSNNQGVTQVAIQNEFAGAQSYYDAAGTNIAISLLYIDTFTVSGTETDPKGDVQLEALHVSTRQRADFAHPGECDVVVGFTNTLRTDAIPIGGQATWPSQDLRECLVAKSNVGTGQTTAHELGHVFGLFHTFETCCGDGDGCQDTPVDSNCAEGGGCTVGCAPNSLSHNVMSYYMCNSPQADAFSACQGRRARCFITKMFNDVCGDATYCNGHGTCSNNVCTCNAGFSGTQCDSCAAGYTGYPNCVQNCPANYCNSHGSCSNNACTCNVAYTGTKCDTCAPGYTGYPNCVQDCPANYCNGHGSCSNNACTCNVGYTGTKCNSCAPGYTGYPNCVQNCPVNYCNGHGSCSNNVCTCFIGYAGPSCNSCATNYGGYPNCGLTSYTCTFEGGRCGLDDYSAGCFQDVTGVGGGTALKIIYNGPTCGGNAPLSSPICVMSNLIRLGFDIRFDADYPEPLKIAASIGLIDWPPGGSQQGWFDFRLFGPQSAGGFTHYDIDFYPDGRWREFKNGVFISEEIRQMISCVNYVSIYSIANVTIDNIKVQSF